MLEGYRASLKPLSVEEPIDVAWHRLLGYAVARASMPTPISADALTVVAIVIGVGSGVALAVPFAHHMPVAAGLVTLSAVFDCADGQLARMRKKSSAFGRMLDGVSDSIVLAAQAVGALVHVSLGARPAWIAGYFALTLLTAASCSLHFGEYDHYKNVYLRLTEPSFREGEDLDHALRRRRALDARGGFGFAIDVAWGIYLFYVRTQAALMRALDPYSSARLNRYPAYDPDRAAIYARHALAPMRVWRSFFGLGTHVFVFSVCTAFDVLWAYVLFRLVVLNATSYGFLVGWQRRASKAAFQQMGLALPDEH